jgi:hypothetical protein
MIQNYINKFKLIERLNPLIDLSIFSESSFLTKPINSECIDVYAVRRNCSYILDQDLLTTSSHPCLLSNQLTEEDKISVASNLRAKALNAVICNLNDMNENLVKEFNLSSSSDDNTEIAIADRWITILQSAWSKSDHSIHELFCVRVFVTNRK